MLTLDELSTHCGFYQHRFCSHCRDWWWSRQLCSCYSCHKTHLRVASFALRVNHVYFWRYSSIWCAYFTTIAKGSFSNSKPRTCSYRAMRISRDRSVGSSIVRKNVLRSKHPFRRRIRSEGRPSPTLCQMTTLAPCVWRFTIKSSECLLKVFGGGSVNMSCSSSITCTIAKSLLTSGKGVMWTWDVQTRWPVHGPNPR